MKRTTVLLPDDLKKKAEKFAHDQGVSFGEIVRESLVQYIKPKKDNSDILFNDNALYTGNAPSDLSVNHDDYLYGDYE